VTDLAALWNAPSGPQGREPRHPDAEDAVNFVRDGYIAAVRKSVREAAEAAGLDEATIALILGEED
jgi:hypothetical protein